MTKLYSKSLLLAVLLLAGFVPGLRAQSCAITSPSASLVIQTTTAFNLTATVTSAPTAYSLEYDIDYQRWRKVFAVDPKSRFTNYGDAWQGAFVATWYPGLKGDGPHVISGVLRDIYGTVLASCPLVSFSTRTMGMSNQSFGTLPNLSGNNVSGTGQLTFLTMDGTRGATSVYIDGRPLPLNCGASGETSFTGGWQIPSMATAGCGFPNGLHLIQAGYLSTFAPGAGDPYVIADSIASVSGTNIAFTNPHHAVQTQPTQPWVVFFTSSSTQYTGVTNGQGCYWTTSTSVAALSPCTFTASQASGVLTVTCSPACPPTASNQPVYFRNIFGLSPVTGLPVCDGLYTNETFISSTSFSIPVSTACVANGINTTLDAEFVWNPYFVQWNDSTHISVSATNGGSVVSLSGSCGGTCSINQRLRSYFYGGNTAAGINPYYDGLTTAGPAIVTRQVNFNNGSAPSQLLPPYWEYHGFPGKTGDTLAALVQNSDGTTSACGGCTYSVTADGTVTSGAISVNASTGALTYAATGSWSDPTQPFAWATYTVTCTTCSLSNTSVTGYIREDPGASIVSPHYTRCGIVATAFQPGPTCPSVFLTGAQRTSPGTGWEGPTIFTAAHFNTMEVGLSGGSDLRLIDPQATSCPSYPDSIMTTNENFARQYNLSLKYDIYNIWFNLGSGISSPPVGGGLGVILNNVGYNRRNCLTTFETYLVSTGLYSVHKNDDETSFQTGGILRMNPTIQTSIPAWSNGWTSAVVSGTGITFNVVNPQTLVGNWSQSAGTGSWIQIVNPTNPCLSGWYPILTHSSTQWTSNNIGSCANGTYEPSGGIAETTAQIGVNQSPLGAVNSPPNPTDHGGNNQQNSTALPSNLAAIHQLWDANLTSIVVSSCVATVNWTGNAILNGTAIRIWGATTSNLNIVAPVTSGTSSFTITYPNIGTGEACPANGTYNSSTDSNLSITVDPNWSAPNNGDPVGQFFSIVNAVPNAISTIMSIQGGGFSSISTVYSYEGNPKNVGGAFVYLAVPVPQYTGDGGGVWQWMNGDTAVIGNAGGLQNRSYEKSPRGVLWSWGVVNGGASSQGTCHGYTFNPGCSKPTNGGLIWRPEEILSQMNGYITHNYVSISNYNNVDDMQDIYTGFWVGGNGTGAGTGINPAIAPESFAVAGYVNAELALNTDAELQPETNKPYLGVDFTTDAHSNPATANHLKIVCGIESPQGFTSTINLPQISGGSMLKYVNTGRTLYMNVLAGNPATDTIDPCAQPGNSTLAAPGQTITYVALPPNPPIPHVDNITFVPPATLPFGATKWLIRVGYYPSTMSVSDDPVTDCTSGCTIPIDHHNSDAYYQAIYANSSSLPLSIGDPVKIANQNLN